ncbi:response regulator [Priestia megaterium]|uniref:response regulator transcription factor n=1 Tax=Priestia megaterium TaxID=1404 RepID=UPI0037478C56
MKYKILIVADNVVAKEDLRSILEDSDTFEIVAEVEELSIALSLIEESKPDLILMDLNMSDILKETDILIIKSLKTPIILKNFNQTNLTTAITNLNENLYLLNNKDPQNLFRTIKFAINREKSLQPQVSIINAGLTQKERLIWEAKESGKSIREISSDLQLSPKNVSSYLISAERKLNANSI